MVQEVVREGETWFECEQCGMLFDDEGDASSHEENCAGADGPGPIQ